MHIYPESPQDDVIHTQAEPVPHILIFMTNISQPLIACQDELDAFAPELGLCFKLTGGGVATRQATCHVGADGRVVTHLLKQDPAKGVSRWSGHVSLMRQRQSNDMLQRTAVHKVSLGEDSAN